MTNKEAIELLKELKEDTPDLPNYFYDEVVEAIDIAIKSIECQGSVWDIAYKRGKVEILDKVSADIERHRRKTESIDTYDLVGDCLDLINNWKGEQNET